MVIGMWENLHPCSTSSAVLRALRRSNGFGWLQVHCNEILRPTSLDQHDLYLVRHVIALFLPSTVPLSILFTPMLICFTLKRLLCFECCLELVRCLLHLRNCRVDPCVVLQSQPLGNFSCCNRDG